MEEELKNVKWYLFEQWLRWRWMGEIEEKEELERLQCGWNSGMVQWLQEEAWGEDKWEKGKRKNKGGVGKGAREENANAKHWNSATRGSISGVHAFPYPETDWRKGSGTHHPRRRMSGGAWRCAWVMGQRWGFCFIPT